MLNKNLIKKSIATAVAGAFMLSATAFAAGSSAVRVTPIETTPTRGLKTGPTGTVVAPQGVGAAGVVKGKAKLTVIQGGQSVKGRAAAVEAANSTEPTVQATQAGSVAGSSVLIGGTSTAPLTTSSGRVMTNPEMIAQGVATLNAQNSNLLGSEVAQALSTASDTNRPDLTLIAEAAKAAVKSGALTQAEASALVLSEVFNATIFGMSIINGSMMSADECREVFASAEAARNLQAFVVRVAKALKASGITDLGKAQELYRTVGARVLAKLGTNTDLLLAKLAGQFGSACRIDNVVPAAAAIDAAKASGVAAN